MVSEFIDLNASGVEPWMDDALCAQVDTEIFFPEKGGSTREAKAICESCDVAQQCLAFALRNDERFGIWGGLSERERRAVKKGKKAMPSFYERAVKTGEREFELMVQNAVREGLVRPPKPAVPVFVPPPVKPVSEEALSVAETLSAAPVDVETVVNEIAAVEAPVSGGEPLRGAAPARPAKWRVSRVWVAFAPDGTMHGPHESHHDAMAFVGSQLSPGQVPGTGEAAPVRDAVVPGTGPRDYGKRAPRPRIEWTAERDELIRRRNGEGVSDKRIADELGLGQPAVSARRKKLGLRPLFRSPNTRGAA